MFVDLLVAIYQEASDIREKGWPASFLPVDTLLLDKIKGFSVIPL